MTGNRVDLVLTGRSILSTATATGNGYLESKPTPDPKGETPRHENPSGGRPRSADEARRQGTRSREYSDCRVRWSSCPTRPRGTGAILKADRMVINYGEKNEIQSFTTSFVSTPASTETYPSEEDRQKKKQASPRRSPAAKWSTRPSMRKASSSS